MGLGTDVLNGVVSLLISVVAIVAMSGDGDESYEMTDVVLAVAVSAFLSGFFTSYFAEE